MKKTKFIIIFFLLYVFFSFEVVFAVESNDIIATCVYDVKKVYNDYAPSKIIVNIDKNYNITFDHFSFQKKWNICNGDNSKEWELISENSYICKTSAGSMTQNDLYDFVYGDYIKDTKFSCENISVLYYKNNLDVGQVTLSHYINKTDKDYKTQYNLNKNESSVNSETPYKEEQESGWLYVCHYDNIVLKFNKTKYELINAYPLYNQDLSEFLVENNYSCPFKYCYFNTSVDGVYGKFLNDDSDPQVGTEICIYSAIYSDDEYTCGGISSIMKDFDENNKNYILTGELNYLSMRNKYEKQVKSFCSSVLKNLNYDDPTNCVEECINIDNDILKRKDDIFSNQQKCGLSEKLIQWIANIVKWLKYIVPVIVIVLGILDFIKAIGADKNDEMKKAQGKFAKRLIAAALIFIIPFIIEFILDKMGFDANGCGIIDL